MTERGHRMPTAQDITEWARACGQPDEAAVELLDLLAEGEAMHQQWRHQLRHGHAALQTEWSDKERAVTHYRSYQILAVPGLLQTPQYAYYRMVEAVRNYGAVESEIQAAVAARMQRQHVLYEPGRTFEFVMNEAALRVGGAPPDDMIGQCDRLIVLSHMPNVTLGIIPLGVLLPTMPANAFVILGGEVSIETHASEITVSGTEAETYKRFADALSAEAVTGDDARRLIAAAVDFWRTVPRDGQDG